AVAVVVAAGEQQVFELIEGDDDGSAQTLHYFHEHFEKGRHQVFAARLNLPLEFGETLRKEIPQIAFIARPGGAPQPLIKVTTQQAGGVVRLRAFDKAGDELASLVRGKRAFGAQAAQMREAGA